MARPRATRLPALAVGVLVASSLLTGCGNNRESAAARAPQNTGTGTAKLAADGVQEIVVAGNQQFRFVPSTIRAKAGRLRIILVNSGSTPHNLQVDQTGGTNLVGAGERSSTTVTLSRGTHQFVCTLHTRLHMVGSIIVS